MPGDRPGPGEADWPHLPALLPRTLPLAGAVEVDAVVPGCPPSTAVLAAAIARLLPADGQPAGAALAPGAVLAPNASLCDTCPRRDSKPERLELTALRRLDTTQPDEQTCFLAQGLVCLGPGTRQGCQPGCLEVNVPCRGCFGPLDGVADGGAAALAAMATLLHGDEATIARLAAELPDPAGLFWRYGYAAGLVPLRPPRERT
jgi:F420-non-reducing hydrogenase small subunit